MTANARLTKCTAVLAAISAAILIVTPAGAQRNTDPVVVGPIGEAITADGMTRVGLEDSVRRFADRFYTSVTQATNQIRNEPNQSPQIRLLMHQWKTVSAQTIVELAIGQDPVTSLLDMMVLTTLSRLMIDGYWAATFQTPDEAKLLSDTYSLLEADVWSIGADLLTPDQISTLRDLVGDWYRDNPDQIYPWYIRLDEFSDQRAAALQNLDRSGGLLGIREARESIEEVQAFGERVLFYMQRAPALMSYELEASVYEILAADEVSSLIANADQFSSSVEEMVEVVAGIPSERLEAIDQLMEQLSGERQALMADLRNTSPEAEGALEEIRLALEAFERILQTLGVNNEPPPDPDAKPFDITEYQTLAIEAGAAAQELTQLLETFDTILRSPAWERGNSQAKALIDRVAEVEERLIGRLYLFGVLLIVTFFICLIASRLLMVRVFGIGQT